MPARLLLLALWLTCASVLSAAPEQPSTPAVKAEIVALVEAQLQAFRAGDWEKAYSYAAIDIRNAFPPERFAQMVKSAYGPIAKSRKAEFGVCLDDGDQGELNVTVEGADGQRNLYQYYLVKEQKGWRISGVKDLASGAGKA